MTSKEALAQLEALGDEKVRAYNVRNGRIEAEMQDAPSPAQWTMNNCLAGIRIHFPEHRKRAIAIGERLGIYRDYPVSKGCTSPFAPIWIQEMVRRQG